MAFKLSFKFDRSNHHGSYEKVKQSITNDLTQKLNDFGLQPTRFYNPSYSSIKVLFPSDKLINKTLDKYSELKSYGYEPRMPIDIKAARTVYCYGFDTALLATYTQPNEIKDILTQAGWKVREVIIMISKTSFKIVMESSLEAKKIIESSSTSISGIQLLKTNKEFEIDPTIKQCWSCGILNPNHNNHNCPNSKHCLKCFSREHQFYNCPLP